MHALAPPPRKGEWREKLVRSGYFFGAVMLHLVVFLMVATLVIWRAPAPPSNDAEFQKVAIKVPPAPIQPPATGAAANNPQFEPQPVTVPDVTPPSMITTMSSSAFNVDASKVINQAMSHASDLMATGSGLGPAGGGVGSGSGNSFFGEAAQGSTLGFEGNFYDFTRTQDGKATNIDEPAYANIVHAFCKAFQPPEENPCYTSNITLFSKFFFFPPIPDHDAGAAFKTPSSTEAFWIAHYHGSFTPDQVGEYRLVGFGDNVCEVRINDRLVLDASDHGYIKGNDTPSPERKLVGSIVLPGKDQGTPLYMGDSFLVEPGDSIHIDIAVGDEGGIFCAGLFLAPKDPTLTFTDKGIPLLPLFGVGTLSDDDKKMLGKYLPPECLTSDVNFSVVKETMPSY
jgi:hypothetical protein